MPIDDPPTYEYDEEQEVELSEQSIKNVLNQLTDSGVLTEKQAQEVRQTLYAAGAEKAQEKLEKFIREYQSKT